MKNLIFTLLIMFVFTFDGDSQINSFENDSTFSTRIAYATPNKDTLYVNFDMMSIMTMIWDTPNNKPEKPVIIPVESVIPFFRTKEK